MLFTLFSALAYDLSSVRADSTAELFRDPLDLLREPGRLPVEAPGWEWHGAFSEQAIETYGFDAASDLLSAHDALSVGIIGPVGATATGAALTLKGAGQTTHTEDEVYWSRRQGAAGWWAWGVPLSARTTLGIAAWGSYDHQGYTLDEETLSLTSVSEKNPSTLTLQTTEAALRVGVNDRAATRWWEVDVELARVINSNEMAGKASLSGFYPNYYLTHNHSAWSPALRIDSEWSSPRGRYVRLFTYVDGTSGQPALTHSTVGESELQLTDGELLSGTASLLGVVGWRGPRWELRGGAQVDYNDWSSTVKEAAQTYHYRSGVGQVGCPVAVELLVHPAWTLRAGGETTFYLGKQEIHVAEEEINYSYTGTTTWAALGLGWRPDPAWKLDLAWYRGTYSYDLSSVRASLVFSPPRASTTADPS